ncbi:Bacteriocin-protection, YdeI or OmpD-Associated [Cnuella takakiae]|uniref:Bacteriocin-protection, YdeI or OmpD-Associated n=1 Tax=Cnuella takakiae TaxID=1302690 RepID=A0A1M5DZX1_9BACT|nr:YdeI/OmpD-associated family protein [Cnuella takakiae]OLY93818.1 hypothetical protein BUE76_19475 [Cnuella takakiae]SHF72548.1 Bacteriocin-protection, YdeI or OmpD-Associated [Cnuella takakiae]
MNTDEQLVDKECLLQKFPGKGGWTYAPIPEIQPDRHAHFGWVRVRGAIDGSPISNYHLMPMGNGQLFLPVKAEIRKKIGKQAGDYVRVTLFADKLPTEIPEELRLCLADEPRALTAFLSYTDGEQKAFIDWIYNARTEATKVERIAKSIDKILKGQKLKYKVEPPLRWVG